MITKTTKGKWVAVWTNSEHVEIRSEENKGKPIAVLSSYYHEMYLTPFEELEANAKLIENAKKMFDLLERVKSEFSQYQNAHGTSKCGTWIDVKEMVKELS